MFAVSFPSILECGETDLRSYLKSIQKLDFNFIRLTWQQMLTAVHNIHKHNIIHSDLKPANFLFVKGTLKLIDFGIARSLAPEATSVLRDSHVGTINYISPEALRDVGDGRGEKRIRVRIMLRCSLRYDEHRMFGRLAASCIKWSIRRHRGAISHSSRSCWRSRRTAMRFRILPLRSVAGCFLALETHGFVM